MQLSPECQALSLGPGRTIAAEVFRRGAQEAPQRRYHHFHPAAEIVWFRKASAVLHSQGASRKTGSGELIYLPSMMPHDFEVSPGETEFVLVLFDPAQELRLPPAMQAKLGSGPLVLAPDTAAAARIEILCEWLVASTTEAQPNGGEPWTAAHLLDLVLTIMAQDGQPVASDTESSDLVISGRNPLARLERAVALIHADPSRALTLSEAASACNLSTAYFARLFKARMGITFGEYLQQYRLNLAAHLAGSSDLGIAEIAWRTGFGSPAHLSTRFAAQFGLSPSRYRLAARTKNPLRAQNAKKEQAETRLSAS